MSRIVVVALMLVVLLLVAKSKFYGDQTMSIVEAQSLVSPLIVLRKQVSLRQVEGGTKVAVSSSGEATTYVEIYPEMETNWQQFLRASERGGQIFFFDSSSDSWAALAGSRGYLLVKDGSLIDAVVTMRN